MKYLPLFTFVLLLSCKNEMRPALFQDVNQKNTIDLSFDTVCYTSSSVFNEVKIINLETKSESLFSKIDQFITNDSEFIILDKASNKILVFDKSGKFKFTFQDSYSNIKLDFSELVGNRFDNNYLVKTSNTSSLYLFNANGKIVDEINLNVDFNYYYLLRNKIFYIKNYRNEKVESKENMTEPLLGVYDLKTKKITSQLLDYQPQNIYKTDMYDKQYGMFSKDENSFFLTIPGSPSYFTITDTNTVVETALNSTNSKIKLIPNDFLFNTKYLGNRKKYLNNHPSMIYVVESIFQVKNQKILTLGGLNRSHIIIDRDKEYIPQENLIYNTAFFGAIPPINQEVIGADDKNFYSHYPSRQFFELINSMPFKDNVLNMNVDINRVYNQNNLMANPIIISFNLKNIH